MLIKYVGKLVAVIPVEFMGDEGVVAYNELYIVNETDDGSKEMLKFNSKLNLDNVKEGTVSFSVDVDVTGRNKPKLVSISE